MFEKVSTDTYLKVQEIKKLALELPLYLCKKIISTGNLGEVEACKFMDWEISSKVNNVGADAKNNKGLLIQIKTFVEGNKGKMLPQFNPDADKNAEVEIIAISILNNKLKFKEVAFCKVSEYKKKLNEVELRRTNASKNINRKIRFDVTLDDFLKIPGCKREPKSFKNKDF